MMNSDVWLLRRDIVDGALEQAKVGLATRTGPGRPAAGGSSGCAHRSTVDLARRSQFLVEGQPLRPPDTSPSVATSSRDASSAIPR